MNQIPRVPTKGKGKGKSSAKKVEEDASPKKSHGKAKDGNPAPEESPTKRGQRESEKAKGAEVSQ